MDKIINYLNSKTNNKFKDLLFFGGVYIAREDKINLSFKYTNENISEKFEDELLNLCKDYLKNIVSNVNIEVKSNLLSMQELKDFVIKILSKGYQSISFDLNELNFDFSGANITVNMQYISDERDEKINEIKDEIESDIFEKIHYHIDLILQKKKLSREVLEARKERYEEDCIISQKLLDSETVEVKDINLIYGEIDTSKALLAGYFDNYVDKLFVVGNVKNCYIKEYTPKRKTETQNDESIQDLQESKIKKYMYFELEYDGKTVDCSWFFPAKLGDIEPLKIGQTILVAGEFREFQKQKSIRVNSLATCSFIPPLPVWRDCPKNYVQIFPEKYEFTQQTNLLTQEIETTNNFLKDNSFIVYDLETTGINTEQCKIIDIGAYKIVNGKITEKFCTFVNPKCPIPIEASSVNHITDDMVANYPLIEQILPDFYKFCFGSTIVGYNNINFDDVFINREGKLNHYNFDNKRFDVFTLAKKSLPGLKNYKLITVCESQGIPLIDAHRAANDALATAKLFIALAEKFC